MNTVKFFNRAVLRPTYKLHVATQRQVNTDAIIDPPDRADIMIPRPKERKNETVEQRKARLIYQSRKRGMLENDLLLGTFVAKYLKTFNDSQLEEYDNLINGPSNDWDIYNWATEIKPTPAEYEHGVMKLLKEHCKNLNKESRLRQPDL
ncbi:succinate dehydrogenase assembly factor 2-A, mitochondrial-like [Tenebrio molitor]|uniref:succinate dehydrogenase assembly factor 2-A, mitochondrial-like n=1 Tax=Tenebrio molitor TaxID=7067 RepID=UPI0036248A6E